ncbi:hypothetical protein CF326_g1487 [Tilletia indica]|uniref:Uncharacterized protein n=1 Tax=Tilletia indica TaxID=43049 RepID=A0A177TMI1_9BASI|nr:hypothetical protein CF326_g1487 [Tilletia indica]KAE8255559.1 hypothetical protein A4X13_0g2994 [Tilletia indica]
MPRFNPNPSSFDKFPGEVVLSILRYFLQSRPRDSQTLKAFVAETIPFQRLSRKFKLAIDVIIGLHFHTYAFPLHHGVHADNAPWHISTYDGLFKHRDYWSFYQGKHALRIPTFGDIVNTLTIPRVPTLRCISLDVRAMEPITKPSLRRWKLLHAPRWVQTTMILTRIASGACGIDELNLRLSPQQDLLNIVQEIVNRNKRLRVIRIEVDSTVVSNRNIRPTIRLDKMFECYKPRLPIERLIIRAPGCNIKTFATSSELQGRFFAHLRQTKEVVLACHLFNALLPTLVWTYHLLRHTPKLELGDVAIHAADTHKLSSFAGGDLPYLQLHALDKLSLQIPEVDTHFLQKINALGLYKMRIRSSVPVSSWPHCVENHFPNLFIANIMCPGPSGLRLRALGVPHKWYYQNLGAVHNHERPHNLPFLAYIKPYSRQRHEPPSQPDAVVYPYRLPEACEMGWDEEVSEDSDSTGSDLSEFEEEEDDSSAEHAEPSSDEGEGQPDHVNEEGSAAGTSSSAASDTDESGSTTSEFSHQDSVSPFSTLPESPAVPSEDSSPPFAGTPSSEAHDTEGPGSPPAGLPDQHTGSPSQAASGSSSFPSTSSTPSMGYPRPSKRSRFV